MRPCPQTTPYHAPVYFNADALAQARALCEAARDEFGIEMGRVHVRHGATSRLELPARLCAGQRFGEVVPWLALNREGLSVLVHPETGDALKDHTEHAIWLGEQRPLDVSMLRRDSAWG